MTAGDILERLLALHPKRIDLSLERMTGLLAALGNPERHLPPVIHVAGTNGKGSVVAFLKSMATAAGMTAHVYTSPHLVRFNERIRLAGRLIEDTALEAVLAECERANAGKPITFFEITTAAAYLAFSRSPADLLLLEVGLGGRLDATNVIPAPLASVITPVSSDHQEFLGKELAGIAREKAGILKAGVPGVIGRQETVVRAAIEAAAATVGAPLFMAGRDWQAQAAAEGWIYEDAGGRLPLPMPGLLGPHQIDNAGLAVAAARQAGLGLSREDIVAGVAAAEWPARMQRVQRPDFAQGVEIFIDGGHNPAAARALAGALKALSPAPLTLIVGMMANRDAHDFLAPFASLSPRVRGVPIAGENCHSPAEIRDAALSLGMRAEALDSLTTGLDRLKAGRAPNGGQNRVLVTGSLYLAGEALGLLEWHPE